MSTNLEKQFKPKVIVTVNPPKIIEGQMLAVHATIIDEYTNRPMLFDKFYMQIIDSQGLEVWPLSTIQKNSSKFDKLISTSELKAGKYLIRVSPSRNLRPIGAVQFIIEKSDNPLVPLIPLVLLAVPYSKLIKKVESDILEPIEPPSKIAILIYKTEMDSRVCKICRGHRANHSPGLPPSQYYPFSPEQPVIGPEELGGQTHYRCRCNFDFITIQQLQKMQQAKRKIYEAKIIKATQIANVYWTSQKALNPLVKR